MNRSLLLFALFMGLPAHADSEEREDTGVTPEGESTSPSDIQTDAEQRREERLERIRERRRERTEERERAKASGRASEELETPEEILKDLFSSEALIEEARELVLMLEPEPITEEAVAWAPLVVEERLPRSVLAHCLWGLDPFASLVDGWRDEETGGLVIKRSTDLTVIDFMGLLPGDRITQVNGYPVGSLAELRRAQRRTRRSRTCTYAVQRGVLGVELRVKPGSVLRCDRHRHVG